MAKFKATSNVVFIVDGKEQSYDKDTLNVSTKKKQQRRTNNTAFLIGGGYYRLLNSRRI